jgi:hypothetical protein
MELVLEAILFIFSRFFHNNSFVLCKSRYLELFVHHPFHIYLTVILGYKVIAKYEGWGLSHGKYFPLQI